MPLVSFHVSHFRGQTRNGRVERDISWEELVHAAITVGRWRDDLFTHGRYSAFEATYRASLLAAYLRQSSSGHCVRTTAYDHLDPTEKSGVSYALGMTIAKVFATRELSVPWLMHLDRYRRVFGVGLRPGRSRPDLIGPRDPDAQLDWVVAEAKGRTHELDSKAVTTMRAQKRRVITIGGKRPILYMGAAAHFTSDLLECRVVDPPARGRPHELFVNVDDAKRGFVRAYYQPILDVLQELSTSDDGYVRRVLPEADLTLAMRSSRCDALRHYMDGESDSLALRADTKDEPDRITGAFTGDDGIRVELGPSWSDDAMMYEPDDRPSADQRI